jgi:phospholipid/cholesterol/gamma-HCH transport system permease protein
VGDRARIISSGSFDLTNVTSVARALSDVETDLPVCRDLELDLAAVDRLDGAGAVTLARFLDRVGDRGISTRIEAARNPETARLITLYRERRTELPPAARRRRPLLAQLGALAERAPGAVGSALDFSGRMVGALPEAAASPRSVDWRSLPRLVEQIGADGLLVTAAANLLIGLIIAFLGVSQLRRFGAISHVPELVVVAQLRELGPLVTAIVVAGRSGAGLASEIATMKVSEEVDALHSMGLDPIRWLVVPRCLALIIALPLLTWIGHVLALTGGLLATTGLTAMTVRAYALATADAITAGNLLTGLVKSPFLALAIGLIACGQGLATYGGAAAVGTRTTSAVVLSIFAVITISALFTFVFVWAGV